jgi:aryl-alcohol dehydrogenase-like predicted oxidoreductase
MSCAGKLVLGTVQFGCQYGINSSGRPDAFAVEQILDTAVRSGITMLDTSSAYGNAEEILGSIGTEQFKVVSKFPRGAATVKEKFSHTLSQLGRNKLYGYLLHHFEVYKNNSAIWDEFKRLRDQGHVERIGFSLYEPSELELLIKNHVDFSLLQIPYNLFDRKFEPYLESLHQLGVEVHVRSTFLQGLFFKERETLPQKLIPLRPYLEELDKYSGESGLTISQLALNFNLQNPCIDGVLIGVDNVNQLKENVISVRDVPPITLDIHVKEKELLSPVNWN